jgi:hemolysin activation/secretion protein
VYEGENIFGFMTELRIPIVPRWYVTIPQIPIRQFATWRLGLYATLFYDAGTVWYRSQRPEWEHMRSGYGAGLNFLLPYSVVIRLDRAWDEYGRGEWIFDLGVAF